MKKIEKNKREVAFLSMISITLITICIYILTDNINIKTFIIFPYIFSIYAFIKLYLGGVAGLLRAIFNIFSYFIILLVTTFISIKLDLNTYIFQYIGILSVFLIYTIFKIPKRIEEKATQIIYKKDIENSTKETNNIPDYSKYEIIQEIKAYTSKPYAFSRCTLEKKIVRVCVAIFLIILPATSFVAKDYMFAIMCVIYALAIIKFGFVRASIFPVLIYLYIQFIQYLKPAFLLTNSDIQWYNSQENYIPKIVIEGLKINSNPLRYLLLGSVITWVIFEVGKISFRIFRKEKSFLNVQTYRKGHTSKSCDMFLKEIAPIRLYTKLAKIDIEIKSNDGKIDLKEVAKLNYIVNASQIEAIDNEYIIAGTDVNEDNKYMRIYAYTKEQDVDDMINIVTKISEENNKKIKEIEVTNDPNWEVYFNEIVPDKYISQEIFNANYINMLSKLQVKMDMDHKILYYFYFKNKKDIKSFLMLVKEKHYDVESVADLKAYKDILEVNEEYPYGVVLSNVGKLGIHRINMLTKDLIDYAKDNSGMFDGWALSELFDLMERGKYNNL